MSMISPETYEQNLADMNLFALRAEHARLTRTLRRFENKVEGNVAREEEICPSPSAQYYWQLRYIEKCTEALIKRYDQDSEYIEDAMSLVWRILASADAGESLIGQTTTTGRLYEYFLFDEEEDVYNHPYNLWKLHEYLLYVAPRNGLKLKFSEVPSLQGLPYNIPFTIENSQTV